LTCFEISQVMHRIWCPFSTRKSQAESQPAGWYTYRCHRALANIKPWVLWKEIGYLGWVQNGKDGTFTQPNLFQNAQKNFFITRKSVKTRKKSLSTRAKVKKRAKKSFKTRKKLSLRTCKSVKIKNNM
jgi:hypothetical protein